MSNTSTQHPVYFDDLHITHTRSPLLEETAYYPFGLTMSGISSKAANVQKNKEQTFQNQRFDDELDLNWVQFKWRNHDPQIGRFIEIDPLSEKYVYNSTYAFSENKVTSDIELEGLESESIHNVNSPYLRAMAKDNVQKHVNDSKNSSAQAVEVKVTVGVTGVGGKVKVAGTEASAGVSGPSVSVSVNGAGKVTQVSGTTASAGVKVENKAGNAGAGVSVGEVKYENGTTSIDIVKGGVGIKPNTEIKKEIKDKGTSGSFGADVSNYTIGIGLKLAVVGVELTVNVKEAYNTAVSNVKAFGNWMLNVVKEITTPAQKGKPE